MELPALSFGLKILPRYGGHYTFTPLLDRFIPSYFICLFSAIVNGILQNFEFHLLLLVYRKAVDMY